MSELSLRSQIADMIRTEHKPQNKWSVPPDLLSQQILELIRTDIEKAKITDEEHFYLHANTPYSLLSKEMRLPFKNKERVS